MFFPVVQPHIFVAVTLASVVLTSCLVDVSVPSANQLRFERLQQTQFMHFSVCTFNDCEQDVSPFFNASTFSPSQKVDTDQWVTVAKSWGAKQICLTAHHSGGFALWQTNTTQYGVRQSPYMNGTADIVRDFVASCRKYNVSPCLYFIPAMDTAESRDPANVRHGHVSSLFHAHFCVYLHRFFAETKGRCNIVF